MQAREFYCPTKTQLPTELAMARWTQRLAVQPELGSARELAGLADEELAALEAEFVRSPVRVRSDRLRHAIPIGVLLTATGGLGLGLQAFASGAGGNALQALQLLGAACLMVGVCVVALGALMAFGAMHLDVSHGTTGLFVGTLDEQHPWLYKALRLTCNPSAESYRQDVLRDRGCLRGVDYIMMREVVAAHESKENVRSARSIAEQLQQLPLPTVVSEPRLIHLASRGERRGRANGAHHDTPDDAKQEGRLEANRVG
ncbi:MAG: hypothetical protein M3Y67_07035 [Pseudomonadota bacterium]|nr:hypothetical protein [Pseudomonadota bacterium]